MSYLHVPNVLWLLEMQKSAYFSRTSMLLANLVVWSIGSAVSSGHCEIALLASKALLIIIKIVYYLIKYWLLGKLNSVVCVLDAYYLHFHKIKQSVALCCIDVFRTFLILR